MKPIRARFVLAALPALLLVLGGGMLSHAAPADSAMTQAGSPERGRTLFSNYCAACHTLPGVTGATGTVGPNLADFRSQAMIVGAVPNTPENLARFLANPASIKPDAIMVPFSITGNDINDLVALLLPPGPPVDEPTAEHAAEESLE